MNIAILIISIVLINTVGKVILAYIDAKNRNSKTRERTGNANNKHIKDKNRKVEIS